MFARGFLELLCHCVFDFLCLVPEARLVEECVCFRSWKRERCVGFVFFVVLGWLCDVACGLFGV